MAKSCKNFERHTLLHENKKSDMLLMHSCRKGLEILL